MKTAHQRTGTRTYHANAYQFVFAALRHAQENLGRDRRDQSTGHVSGRELLEGVRDLARQHFGLMTISVFADWGIHATEDFGKIVFELIEAEGFGKAGSAPRGAGGARRKVNRSKIKARKVAKKAKRR